uniref:Eukaryotic translation initiation factor 2-alpha kinase 2 n=1 Tax=Poecilia latipinna TaxID=48699 RepID=A0A3B3V1Q5_9TELE
MGKNYGKPYPIGEGKNKPDAKLNAAQNAIRCLRGDQHQDTAEYSAETSSLARQNDINYICWLNQYGQTNRVTVKPEVTVRWCKFVVGDTEYPEVSGKSKREAKEEAAKLVYEMINSCIPLYSPVHQNQMTKSLSINSEDNCTESGFVAIIHNYCQRKKLSLEYILVERSGPPHNPRFFYKLKIETREYRVAEGKNKKEAQHNAAKLAWSSLQEQSDFDSKVGNVQIPLVSSSSRRQIKMFFTLPLHFSEMTGSSDPADSSQASSDQVLFTSEFEILKYLGGGGFGRVFMVKEKLLDLDYAVKIVPGTEKALREVTVLSELQHKNIVRYYNCWMEDSKYLFIKMELCKSATLKQWIGERNQEDLPHSQRGADSLPIALQTVSGVEYIHSNNFIHRDLKPPNIMFGKNGKVKIGDFGLVTIDRSEILIDRTVGPGTEIYMAPEQVSKVMYQGSPNFFLRGPHKCSLLWSGASLSSRGGGGGGGFGAQPLPVLKPI